MQCAGRLRLCAARTPAAATRRLARARQNARVVSSAAEGGAVANGAERIRRDGQGASPAPQQDASPDLARFLAQGRVLISLRDRYT